MSVIIFGMGTMPVLLCAINGEIAVPDWRPMRKKMRIMFGKFCMAIDYLISLYLYL